MREALPILRSSVLTLVLLAGVALARTPGGAQAQEPGKPGDGSGTAADAPRMEEVLDRGTARMREALHDLIDAELERWQRRELLSSDSRRAVDRALASLPSNESPAGRILVGKDRVFVGPRQIRERVARARVIYVAEQHDHRRHHEIQLEIIRLAYDANPHLMIGMEQFERHLQPHLDDYTQSRIDEPTFLERVDWKKSWGFDWSLYQPILAFAREHRLKVVALNARRGLVRQVGKGGIASLSAGDRAQIAAEIDTTDSAHREQFMAAFSQHGSAGGPMADHYYEAMCVWDETMAESAARAIAESEHPDTGMVVLAGAGHIAYDFGIPARVRRRTGFADLTVVPVAVRPEEGRSELEDALLRPQGDLIYFTDPVAPATHIPPANPNRRK